MDDDKRIVFDIPRVENAQQEKKVEEYKIKILEHGTYSSTKKICNNCGCKFKVIPVCGKTRVADIVGLTCPECESTDVFDMGDERK